MFINVDDTISSYLPSYKINLIHPDLPDGELEKLSSELGIIMQFIKKSNDKNKLLEILEKNKRLHKISIVSATLIKETTGLNFKISKEKESIDMNKGVKELLEDSEKKGELNTVYKIIKTGVLSIEQAAKSIGLTKEQLLAGFKEYNLVL